MSRNPFKIMQKRWKLLVSAGFLGSLFAIIFTLLVFPLEYRADAQVIIIPQNQSGLDPYTSIRSAERIGENLAQIIKTQDFFNKVLARENSGIDKTAFDAKTENEKRKLWQASIAPSVVYGTGILNLSAFSENSDQAVALSGTVAQTLVSRGWEYVGGDIVIKIVNQPVATRFQVRPNLALNAFVGFLVAFGVMSFLAVRKFK